MKRGHTLSLEAVAARHVPPEKPTLREAIERLIDLRDGPRTNARDKAAINVVLDAATGRGES